MNSTAISLEQATKGLSARQREFARMVASGTTQKDAYKAIYKPGKRNEHDYAVMASRVSARPGVKAAIAMLQKKSEAKTILSLNDRLAILAKDAQIEGNTPADRHARARTIEVYNKTAGDGKPEQHELTVKGDPAQPLVTVTRQATKAEKAAAMRANREARKAAAQ